VPAVMRVRVPAAMRARVPAATMAAWVELGTPE
jgi:hypothetical protein